MLLKQSGGYEARDPSVIYHNGMYYHCFVKNAEEIYIAASDKPENLLNATDHLVFKPEPDKEYSKQLWAPELHIIENKCYIYIACDDGLNKNHRMYVLENNSDNPLNPYHVAGKITDSTDRWAIDGTVLQYKNELYMLWSGWEKDINDHQNIYIAKMSDPYTICSERVMISTPEYDWEKMDCVGDGVGLPLINEGPCVYIKNDKLFVFYSASGSWANNYCIGILEFLGGDLLNPHNYKKQPFPALSSKDGLNGPGHCSVFSDLKDDFIAFHNYDKDKTEGWQNVHAIISRFELKDGKIILK